MVDGPGLKGRPRFVGCAPPLPGVNVVAGRPALVGCVVLLPGVLVVVVELGLLTGWKVGPVFRLDGIPIPVDGLAVEPEGLDALVAGLDVLATGLDVLAAGFAVVVLGTLVVGLAGRKGGTGLLGMVPPSGFLYSSNENG